MHDDIHAVMVTMLVAGDHSLFVLLAADGSINRLGTGTEEVDRTMYIGLTEPATFPPLRDQITPDLLQWCGRHLADPNPAGTIHELTVGFRKADGDELVTKWRYGSESMGPPPEVCDFVFAALKATEPWFQEQRARNKMA